MGYSIEPRRNRLAVQNGRLFARVLGISSGSWKKEQQQNSSEAQDSKARKREGKEEGQERRKERGKGLEERRDLTNLTKTRLFS